MHSAKRQGAQLVMLAQARSLCTSYELTVAIGDGPLRDEFAQLGRLAHEPSRAPVWGASAGRWALDLARVAPDALRLAALARRTHAVAIVASSSVLIAPVLAARLTRTPALVYVQEAPSSRAARALIRFHGRLADTVIAISSAQARAFGRPHARIVLSPPGIPIPAWSGPAPRPSGGPLRLAVVGTIDVHKRQRLAIEVLARLVRAGVPAELELVGAIGDGRYAAELWSLVERERLTTRVTLVGETNDPLARIRRADLLLVPGGEVTPLVIMEAMALGTPVVAARMGSIPEVVADGSSGLLFEPDDVTGAVAAIDRLRLRGDVRTTLVARARERVVTEFDQARTARTLEQELSRLRSR